jgi:hypothetical protein
MSYQAAVQKIEQAAAEQWEELDLSGMGLTELPPEIGQLGQLIFGKFSRHCLYFAKKLAGSSQAK